MTILNGILEVFSSVGTWFSTALTNLLPIFWDASANSGEGALTVLGVLAVCGLAFSVVFLLVGIIQGFLRFR